MAAPSPAAMPIREIIRAAQSRPVTGFGRGHEGSGGVVSVRGYSRVRNGRPEQVGAHQRSNPDHADSVDLVVPAMARRPGPFDDPRGKMPLLEGGPGMGNRGGGPPASRPTPAAPQRSPAPAQPEGAPPSPQPAQSPAEILAPGGVPIGTARRRTAATIRGMPGGDQAAREMFDRLTVGRGGTDITPPRFDGRIVRLPDGSTITYRRVSSSGGAAIDTRIPGFRTVRRLHYPLQGD